MLFIPVSSLPPSLGNTFWISRQDFQQSFRYILVKYSDRGLVQNGKVDHKLLSSLHWVTFFALSTISYVIFPLSKHLHGGYPLNSIKGQICTKIDFEIDVTNTQQRVYVFIIPLVLTIFNLRFIKIMRNHINSKNLKKIRTLSQYGGKHHRNIFTAKETICYFLVHTLTLLTDNASIIFFQINRGKLDKDIQFSIYNMIWVLSSN